MDDSSQGATAMDTNPSPWEEGEGEDGEEDGMEEAAGNGSRLTKQTARGMSTTRCPPGDWKAMGV